MRNAVVGLTCFLLLSSSGLSAASSQFYSCCIYISWIHSWIQTLSLKTVRWLRIKKAADTDQWQLVWRLRSIWNLLHDITLLQISVNFICIWGLEGRIGAIVSRVRRQKGQNSAFVAKPINLARNCNFRGLSKRNICLFLSQSNNSQCSSMGSLQFNACLIIQHFAFLWRNLWMLN